MKASNQKKKQKNRSKRLKRRSWMKWPTLIDHMVKRRARSIQMMNSSKRRAIEIKAKCQGRQEENGARTIAKQARRDSQKV